MSTTNTQKGAVGDPLVIPVILDDKRFCEIGVTFYTDNTYTTTVPYSALSGTVSFTATPHCNEYEQPIANGVIDVSIKEELETPIRTVSSISSITATPAGITGAAYWKMEVVAFENGVSSAGSGSSGGSTGDASLSLEESIIIDGKFRRGYDYLSIPGSSSAYWQIITPAVTPSALLSRVLKTRQTGNIEYRVYTGSTGIVVDGTPIIYKTAGAEVQFDRVTSITTPGTEVDFDLVPATGGGAFNTGSSAGGQAVRPQPAATTFLLEAANLESTAVDFNLYLTWAEGDLI